MEAISEKIDLDAAHPYKLESIERSATRVRVDIEVNVVIPA
jgi:hypothetical protein